MKDSDICQLDIENGIKLNITIILLQNKEKSEP